MNMTYKKSKIIQISPKNNTQNTLEKEYGLTENVFDPFKSSPPNDFMLKLQQRMTFYDSCTKEIKHVTE